MKMKDINLIRMALQAVNDCFDSNGELYDDYSANLILQSDISKSDKKRLTKLAHGFEGYLSKKEIFENMKKIHEMYMEDEVCPNCTRVK